MEQMQKNLNQFEEYTLKFQQEIQKKELENQEMRNEIQLLLSKKSDYNQAYIREKDKKIQDLHSKIEILNQQVELKEDKIKDLLNQQFSLKKAVEDIKEDFGSTELQIQINKQNIVQKDLEINQAKQTIFEKDKQIYQKEQQILQLELSISKKRDLIKQFKDSSENQVKKLCEKIEEQEREIQNLQKERNDQEQKINNVGQEHKEEIDKIIKASKFGEEEKKLLKQLMDDNERMKAEKQMNNVKEQNLHYQIAQLQRSIDHQKKENEMHEQNIEDLVTANNLVTKKLFEKDDQFIKELEIKGKEIDLKEKKYNTELKYTRQAMETLKIEKQKIEVDLQKNLNTLRKENQLLLNNMKSKQYLSPNKQYRSQIFTSMIKYDPDQAEIDRITNINGFNDRGIAEKNLLNSNPTLFLNLNQYSLNNGKQRMVVISKIYIQKQLNQIQIQQS